MREWKRKRVSNTRPSSQYDTITGFFTKANVNIVVRSLDENVSFLGEGSRMGECVFHESSVQDIMTSVFEDVH